jgi:hypothetical protein
MSIWWAPSWCRRDPAGSLRWRLAVRLGQAGAGQFRKLRNRPKQDMLVGGGGRAGRQPRDGAGWALLLKFALAPPRTIHAAADRDGGAGIRINAVLMVLNLLPIPPLDGGRIAVSLLPHRLAMAVRPARTLRLSHPAGLLFTGVLAPSCDLCSFGFRYLLIRSFSDSDAPCTLNVFFPACAPPGACTSATTTAC